MKLNRISAWLLPIFLFTACVERRVVVHERVPANPPPETVIVSEAPPAPRVEVAPAAPGPEYVWVGGYWSWQGRWVWVPGHWATRPGPRSTWVAGHWAPRRRGYVWVPGHWR